MRHLFISLVVFAGFSAFGSGPAAAQSFARCAGYQSETVQLILPRTVQLARSAAAGVVDDATFATWFGIYSPARAERVRRNLKAIHRVLDSADLRFYCGDPNEPTCKGSTYAYVYSTEPYAVTLCPMFFTMPMLPGGSPSDAVYEDGTMEGTLIHEISHFDVVAGTDDSCYSRSDCADMAIDDPTSAMANADSYQYFAEDVMFALRADDGVAARTADK